MRVSECPNPLLGQTVAKTRSHSAQGLATSFSSPSLKIPMPPRLWITDVSSESSDDLEAEGKDDPDHVFERPRVRSRFRMHKHKSVNSIPIGIFWDIENCQVPRGCSAIDVVSAIRAKFLSGRREADFVVVCDVRKETAPRLQELNDAQVSLIHVCGTQKNAADEKLRQCMRRFGELHTAPAALLLISGDINFAADLSDFRYRKNMDVILVHKQNTSSALIACASSHYCYNALTAHLPRNQKSSSQSEVDDPACELEVDNLPVEQPPERVARRLRRLADNCGGKVLKVSASTALMRFPTPDHASRALKRMDGEDVFGRKISTRNVRSAPLHSAPVYSSDEGYSTAPQQRNVQSIFQREDSAPSDQTDWSLALQQLPVPNLPLPFQPSLTPAVPKPRKIRGAHGVNLDQSGASSGNSGDDSQFLNRDNGQNRAISPWNSSASFSEQSSESEFGDSTAELTVANLPPYDMKTLNEMVVHLFTQYVPVVRVSIRTATDGPIATVVLRSENDARLAIARLHKRWLENQWFGRRLELSLGRASPAPNLEVLKTRLKRLLLDQPGHTLPLLRLRDAYASRHSCSLTTSDLARVKDTVVVNEGFGRMVQLIDASPVMPAEVEDAPWRCSVHGGVSTGHEDGSRILLPVYVELSTLASNTQMMLETHSGIVPLLSYVECYEAMFETLSVDAKHGVALELLLRSIPGLVIKENPSRHITWHMERTNTPSPVPLNGEQQREGGRTAPALAPMLALLERELLDLVRTTPRCTLAFSRFIPAYHHHFGRQCRVADYGFTKLPELLAALSNTVVVLGSGSSRLITLSAAAQSRRWTADLIKILKAQPLRSTYIREIPQLFPGIINRPFIPADYGVCTLTELMTMISPQAVIISPEGIVTLPRRPPTPDELVRTKQFSLQAVELLCLTPNLRMEFSRFVPAYHAHFGRQCRVAYYGFTKLAELFEAIPDTVTVKTGPGGEKTVRLALKPARAIMGERLRALAPVSISVLPSAYAVRFGAHPLPDSLDVDTLEGLVFASGGCVENYIVRPPGGAPRWATAALTACAVLSGDRSVASRGSTEEYFSFAFMERYGSHASLMQLSCAGVLQCVDGRVLLNASWRVSWRVALLLAVQTVPIMALNIEDEYMRRYELPLPYADLGFDSTLSFMRYFRELFAESVGPQFALCVGVTVPLSHELPRGLEDFSLFDTPPGQKGSRVFDTPPAGIWCSPPASAVPCPSALLTADSKRRTRLAAMFNSP